MKKKQKIISAVFLLTGTLVVCLFSLCLNDSASPVSFFTLPKISPLGEISAPKTGPRPYAWLELNKIFPRSIVRSSSHFRILSDKKESSGFSVFKLEISLLSTGLAGEKEVSFCSAALKSLLNRIRPVRAGPEGSFC